MSSVSIIYYACLTNPRQFHSFYHDSLLKEGLHFPGIPFSYFWIPATVKKKKKLVWGENININTNQSDLLFKKICSFVMENTVTLLQPNLLNV